MNNNGFQFYNSIYHFNNNQNFQNPQINLLMIQYMMNFIQSNNMNNSLNNNFGFNQPYTINNVIQMKKKDDIKVNNKNKFVKKTISKKQLSNEEKVEIEKWVLARKKNFPTKTNILEKEKKGKIKVDVGMISKLELKLRKKVNLLKKIDGKKMRNNRNKKNKKNKNNFNILKEEKNIELEEGEIQIENKNENNEKKIENNNNENKEEIEDKKNMENKEKQYNKNKRKRNKKSNKNNNNNVNKAKTKFSFKYKHNFLYDNLLKKEKIQEQNIILQVFRYFIKENLV